MPFAPGVSGNPGGKSALLVDLPKIDELPKDRTKQANNLRQGAFVIAKHLEARIIAGLRRAGKKEPLPKGLREAVWCHGVEADKVLQGAQDQPSTVNQINLLFGSVAPALQRAILGKAFDVLQGKPVQNAAMLRIDPQPVDCPQASEPVELRSTENGEQSSGLTNEES